MSTECCPQNPILYLLRSYGDNGGRYNALKILPHLDRCMVAFILGARRIGKTDLFLRLACDLYQQYGLKTMWMRNKDVELTDPSFYGDFLNDAKLFKWCPEDWEARADGVHVSADKDSDIAIKFQAVSTFSNRRGGAHPDVELIVMDEIMPEDRRYPKRCATGLLSITMTVFNGRPTARLFCLSNFTEATNPYFVKYRIFPGKNRDVTVFPDKRMLIERCNGYVRSVEDGNPWADVYKAAGVGMYEREDEDPMMALIKRTPKGAKPAPYLIVSDGQQYRYWLKDNLVYWSEFKGGDGIVRYTPNLNECTDTVKLMPNMLRRDIQVCLESGVLRFNTPNTMYAILSCCYTEV